VNACATSYHIDKWEGQEYRPEVWIEKDALIGIIEGVCNELDISYFSCRGYTSTSEMWGAAMRHRALLKSGQVPFVIHFGDHDPSGIDMSRDIADRLELFTTVRVNMNRIALTWEQIEYFSPPPNPTKVADSRAAAYMRSFGTESWELDALEPRFLVDLIKDQVARLRDDKLWNEMVAREEAGRTRLEQIAAEIGES